MRQRITLDGFSFSQQDVGKTISLEGSAKVLVDGTMCNEVEQGLGHQVGSASWTSLVSCARWRGFLGLFDQVRPCFLILEVKDAICALNEHSIIDICENSTGKSLLPFVGKSVKSPSWVT